MTKKVAIIASNGGLFDAYNLHNFLYFFCFNILSVNLESLIDLIQIYLSISLFKIVIYKDVFVSKNSDISCNNSIGIRLF